MNKYAIQRKLLNLYVFTYLLKLNRTFPYKPEKIIKLQNKKLKKVIKCAYKIPFYREMFDNAGVKPEDIKCAEDLKKLPTIKKQDYKRLIEEQKKANPYIEKSFFKSSSSGSTGIPFTSYRSPKTEAMDRANWIRFSMKNGHNPFFGKTMKFGNPSHIVKSNKIMDALHLLRLRVLSYIEEEAVLIEKYNEFKPDYIYTTKSNFITLVQYAKKHNIALHQPKCYSPIGELVEPHERKYLEEMLGKNYFSSYGFSEAGACTFITDRNEYHNISHETHIINVYDEDNNLSDKGRFIVTSLFNLEIPLINYDVGDSGETFIGEDGLKYIKTINGRCNDWLTFEDGTSINYQKFNVATQTRKDIFQFRFIQEDYHNITVQLVKMPDMAVDEAEVETALEKAFNEIISRDDIAYKFEWMKEIPPDENGKRRMIISKVKPAL